MKKYILAIGIFLLGMSLVAVFFTSAPRFGYYFNNYLLGTLPEGREIMAYRYKATEKLADGTRIDYYFSLDDCIEIHTLQGEYPVAMHIATTILTRTPDGRMSDSHRYPWSQDPYVFGENVSHQEQLIHEQDRMALFLPVMILSAILLAASLYLLLLQKDRKTLLPLLPHKRRIHRFVACLLMVCVFLLAIRMPIPLLSKYSVAWSTMVINEVAG